MPDGSRLALGATTVALVGLASAGTSLLISHGTKTLEVPPTALPSRSTVGHPPAAGGLVVPRVPGSFVAVKPGARPAPAGPAVAAAPPLLTPVLGPADVLPLLPGPVPVPDVVVPAVLPVPAPTTDPVAVLVPGTVTFTPQSTRGWSRFSPTPTPAPTDGPVLQPSTSGTSHSAKAAPTRTKPVKAKPAKTKPAKTKPAKAHGRSADHGRPERPTTFSPRHDGR